MGKITGAVEGRTKLGTWIEFKKEMSKARLLTKHDQEAAGLYRAWPANKKEAFEIVQRKPDDTGWILPYRYET
jgi:hypothetical protein